MIDPNMNKELKKRGGQVYSILFLQGEIWYMLADSEINDK
jgi:hypothetical protein